MPSNLGKAFGVAPLFEPDSGMLVREPLQIGPGWWAGAPGATFDPISNAFYLVYRLRQPREQGRGVECRVAASDDGVAFTDIWALPKASLDALSVERASLLRGLDGIWRLYVSYVTEADHRWRIAMMEGDEPDRLALSSLTPILTADSIGGEGVKDPNVLLIGRMYYMLVSYATSEADVQDAEERKHGTADIFNTGLTRSRTGAAISGDGRRFDWIGDVSPLLPAPMRGASGRDGTDVWDGYCRRTGALLPLSAGGYLAFYDGSRSVAENYEERTGLAMTFDLRNYHSLTPNGPALVSPAGSGSLRYLDVLPVGHELFYYYEIARPDGAHELRVSVVERE